MLSLRRSALAPAAALATGAATIAGIVAVHLLPGWWGFVSDPYWDFAATGLSWLLAAAPLVAGVLLAAQGARELPGTAPAVR